MCLCSNPLKRLPRPEGSDALLLPVLGLLLSSSVFPKLVALREYFLYQFLYFSLILMTVLNKKSQPEKYMVVHFTNHLEQNEALWCMPAVAETWLAPGALLLQT